MIESYAVPRNTLAFTLELLTLRSRQENLLGQILCSERVGEILVAYLNRLSLNGHVDRPPPDANVYYEPKRLHVPT